MNISLSKVNLLEKIVLTIMIAAGYNAQIICAPCGATVLWHNLSGASGGVVSNVIDQNIDVQGINALVEGIHVEARTCDVLITVTNGDAVITGSGNRLDMVSTNSSRLYLYAGLGRKITFSLADDLTFSGTANGAIPLDLLVTVSGGGIVQFLLAGGNQVSFTSTPSSGGTQVFVGMDTVNIPTLLFSRPQPLSGPGLALDAAVRVGNKSGISFMAVTPVNANPTERANISFDTSNTGLGKFSLFLDQHASFVMFGHLITAPGGLNSELQLNDIALNIPAGLQARLLLDNGNSLNPNAWAALQLVNNNQVLTNYFANPFCENTPTGTQTGFILGANGLLELNNITYLDYIGTATNQVPNPDTPISNLQPQIADLLEDDLLTVQDLLKARNPSAFVIDGNANSNNPATILFHGSSAIYFRSGCDEDGEVFAPTYTISPLEVTLGAGNIVFDIEGALEVQGDPLGNNALNILSWQVTSSGCPIFVESNETQFPERTFAIDSQGAYLRYNNAAFLINNRVNLRNVCLLHTDTNHFVFERDNLGRTDLNSEPCYIGGETFFICLPIGQPRPTIALYNSFIRFSENAGFTGVDILVANNQNAANISTFRFYGNGRAVDNAYGRYVILGTNLGATSETGAVLISNDSHLDIFQETADILPGAHTLLLDVGSNTTCITPGIVGNISQQYSVHSIWLGNESNISIGTNADTGINSQQGSFVLTTTPTLFIEGDFLSFVTHGGSLGLPETSGTTGQGAIFVDKNGVFGISPNNRANVSAMVVKSKNGIINLPKRQVYFSYRIGITDWKIMLSQASQRVLIPSDQRLSKFLMDWGAVTKDYTSTNSFVPFEPPFTPLPCQCPPVTDANLRALPIVQGEVDQFLIKRSRIGDQVHLLCDGGNIRELIFLTGYNTAEAAAGFIVVQNNGRVGLGSARANIDSVQAEFVLGVNGVTLCANGTGVIELNDNMIINNVCHIVTGTAFGVSSAQTLEIHSDDPVEIRVKSSGLLDLSDFDNENKIIKFGGQVSLVFEPGSQLVLGGGILIFTDLAKISFERILNDNLLVGTQPSDLDASRVKIIGTGTIIFNEAASMLVHDDTFVGIESSQTTCPILTDLKFVINDDATIQIGNDDEPGGVLQVGNTQCIPGSEVNVTFIVRGIGSEMQINRRGMLGLGVGIVNKLSQIPNQWQVGCLDNVGTVSIAIERGIFRDNQIFTGDDNRANLFAIGPAQNYTFFFDPIKSTILGGGNMVLVSGCLTNTCQIISSLQEIPQFLREHPQLETLVLNYVNEWMNTIEKDNIVLYQSLFKRSFNNGSLSIVPTVTTFSGEVNANLSTGLFSSRDLLSDSFQGAQPVNVSPSTFFNYLTAKSVINGYASPKSTFALTQQNTTTLGYVFNNLIQRIAWFVVLGGSNSDPVSPLVSLTRGAVAINIDTSNGLPVVINELQGV